MAEVVIPSVVEVSNRAEITLYDIVEVKNLTEALESELKAIVLATDATDSKLIFQKSNLAKALRNIKARFVLPNELKLVTSKSAVSRMEIERKIKNKLLSSCTDCDLQIQIASVPTYMDSNWNLDLNIDFNKSHVMVPISSQVDSGKKGWVSIELKRYQLVPVLNRSVKIGDVISSDMLSMEKRQSTTSREIVIKPEAVEGMQASRFLSAGQILNYSDLKREQVLKKGQMVKAVFGTDNFEVAITAEVQESASIGDVVKVKNQDSKKVFAAKVVNRGLVRIE